MLNQNKTGVILKCFYKVYNKLGHGFLKTAESLIEEHEHQLVNYLKATNIEVGLLLNFGKDPQFKRKVFSNERKRLNPDPR